MADSLIRQRDYLLDISRALTSQLSLSEVLRRVLRSSTEMLGGQAGIIALAEEGTFAVRASYGIKASLLQFFAPLLTDIPRGDPTSFSIPELNLKVRLVADAAGLGLHHALALPMAIGRELVGVVYIFTAYGGAYGPNEIQLLESFANQAAIAVQNARLYEQMQTEKGRLDAILRHSGDGIMILGPDQRIQSINPALARIVGHSLESAEGAHHDEVIIWSHREPGMSLAEAIAGGWPLDTTSTLYVEGDLLRPDESTISVGITYAPMFGPTGQLRNIIANVRDITRFRAAEEAKSTFVSVISHELKTPVSLIKGYASTLRREDAQWDRSTVLSGLQVIEEEADRLTGLIENLLDATRLQAGAIKLQMVMVALDRLAHRLVEKFRTQTQIHTIEADFPPDFPVIPGDEQRLEQVLANLLSNAIKYSPDGGRITITGEVLSNEVRIAVSDEGIGLQADQAERVFDRFYRADNALTRQTQGAGLGLYIVRSIVEAHRGRIWASGQLQGGSAFVFTLPLDETKGGG